MLQAASTLRAIIALMHPPHFIKSKDNDFFKTIKSYHSAKYRKRDKVLIAEGAKLCHEALFTLQVRHIIVSKSYYDKHFSHRFENNAVFAISTESNTLREHTATSRRTQHPPCHLERSEAQSRDLKPSQLQVLPDKLEEFDQSKFTIFADSLFAQISELKTNQGILGIFEQPSFEVNLAELSKIVILEGIQDPTNVGAIIRNAHCLGYELVVLGEACAHPFSPKVIRSSMGSVFRLPTFSLDSSEHLLQKIQDLKGAGFSIVGTALSGDEQAPGLEKFALLIGSEGSGLSQQAIDVCDSVYTIKMDKSAESLNAAVASGIAMYLLNNPSHP